MEPEPAFERVTAGMRARVYVGHPLVSVVASAACYVTQAPLIAVAWLTGFLLTLILIFRHRFSRGARLELAFSGFAMNAIMLVAALVMLFVIAATHCPPDAYECPA